MEMTYQRAFERFAALVAADGMHVAQECRSILLTHGHRTKRVTVFLHGLTASPPQFSALAAEAHRRGENVIVPRLPRHGHRDRMTHTLRDLRSFELLACTDEILAIARGLGESVRVVGFSLGGLLGTWIAQHYRVERVVAIAPFLGIAWVPQRLTTGVVRLINALPNLFIWWDPRLRANLMPAHGYPRFATRAIAQALMLAREVQNVARMGPPRSPITLVTNAGETGVNNRAVRRLAQLWGAHDHSHVEHHEFAGLGFSHDIIEPLRNASLYARSHPLLIRLLYEHA